MNFSSNMEMVLQWWLKFAGEVLCFDSVALFVAALGSRALTGLSIIIAKIILFSKLFPGGDVFDIS